MICSLQPTLAMKKKGQMQNKGSPLHSIPVSSSRDRPRVRVRGSAETVTVLEAAAVKWSQLGRERNARASKIGILVPNFQIKMRRFLSTAFSSEMRTFGQRGRQGPAVRFGQNVCQWLKDGVTSSLLKALACADPLSWEH